MKRDYLDRADIALEHWGAYEIALHSGALGFPSSTAEGRLRRGEIGNSGLPKGSRVPVQVLGSRSAERISAALSHLNAADRQAAHVRYIAQVLDREAIPRHLSINGISKSAWYEQLTHIKTYVSGWIDSYDHHSNS